MKIILSALILLATTCNSKSDKTELVSISISSSGGMQGFTSSGKISSDSIVYFQDLHVDNLPAIEGRKLNTAYNLADIVTKDDLKTFPTIKNGGLTAMYDGIDTKIIIETKKGKYTVVNGDSSGVWQKIRTSMDKIFDKEFNRKN